MVPLKFARTAANCPIVRNPVFSASGSPMLARAMNSWMAALCAGSHGMHDRQRHHGRGAPGAPGTPGDSTDVALTTRSANSQGISTGKKKYLYAPVAVTAVSVAYWFDNP